VSSASRQTVDLGAGGSDQLRLAVRTSMRNEFRDASGALGLFELNHQFTRLGALRTVLAKLPGIQFETERTTLWSTGPDRFTFKNRVFQISTPFRDIRIGPLEPGAIYPETEELLRLVSEHLFPKWQSRARSRFFRH
jgi:hypothetical protein